MKKISLGTLNIMATHKCNLACAHCMRGDADNTIMSDEVLDAVFNDISTICELNITGGEPFLAPSVIKKITEYDFNLHHFGIVTNGTIYNEDLLKRLKELSLRTKGTNYISVSSDKYHDKELEKLNLLEKRNSNSKLIEQFCKENGIDYGLNTIHGILNEGRARNLNLDKDNLLKYMYPEMIYYKKIELYDTDILVDTNGNVCIAGDICYENIPKICFGNVLKKPLNKIIHKEYVRNYKRYQ